MRAVCRTSCLTSLLRGNAEPAQSGSRTPATSREFIHSYLRYCTYIPRVTSQSCECAAVQRALGDLTASCYVVCEEKTYTNKWAGILVCTLHPNIISSKTGSFRTTSTSAFKAASHTQRTIYPCKHRVNKEPPPIAKPKYPHANIEHRVPQTGNVIRIGPSTCLQVC